MRIRIVLIVAVCALFFAALPRPVLADDGCGLLGFVLGCNYDQNERQADRVHSQEMAQIQAQATQTALTAQHQAQQLEYQRWLASEQAQQELARIAARERIDSAKIQAELEQMYAQERMANLAATTSFNIAALQSDAMIAVAGARADAARAEQTTAALVALAVLAVAGALAYAAWQYRRAAEVRSAPRLLPDDDWQRRAVLMLEQQRVPYRLRDQRLIAQIDGEWVLVEED